MAAAPAADAGMAMKFATGIMVSSSDPQPVAALLDGGDALIFDDGPVACVTSRNDALRHIVPAFVSLAGSVAFFRVKPGHVQEADTRLFPV